MDKETDRKSYLLRMWQVIQDGQPVWRASICSTATGRWQNFHTLNSLFSFLSALSDDDAVTSENQAEITTEPAVSELPVLGAQIVPGPGIYAVLLLTCDFIETCETCRRRTDWILQPHIHKYGAFNPVGHIHGRQTV